MCVCDYHGERLRRARWRSAFNAARRSTLALGVSRDAVRSLCVGGREGVCWR